MSPTVVIPESVIPEFETPAIVVPRTAVGKIILFVDGREGVSGREENATVEPEKMMGVLVPATMVFRNSLMYDVSEDHPEFGDENYVFPCWVGAKFLRMA